MKKLVIIGANEFQNPLILKAKEMGYETHVFAWKDGAAGEKEADYFYPISITEVDEILKVCRTIGPDGVASIGSDLANITAAKLAKALGLPENDLSSIEKSINKAARRRAFQDDCIGSHRISPSTGQDLVKMVIQTAVGEKPEVLQLDKKIPLWETPIQELYGWENCKNRLFVKRDDLLGFSFGGNKVRFAQKFLEDMKQKNCDSMIIYGSYHSNLCRILSVACRRENIPCYMIDNQEDAQGNGEEGNGSLIQQMGAVPISCGKKNIADAVSYGMKLLREQGHTPYYIYGNIYGEGNESVPMEAYVECYREICKQQEEHKISFDYIFLASSTNATQSGMLAGKFLENHSAPMIVGISVSRNKIRGREVIGKNIRQYFERKGKPLPENWEKEVHFSDEWLCGGYGCYGKEIAQTIVRMYEENGIALDPVYTGKGFYGMMEYLKREHIEGKNILFLHTGGTPLFFDSMKEIFAKANERQDENR